MKYKMCKGDEFCPKKKGRMDCLTEMMKSYERREGFMCDDHIRKRVMLCWFELIGRVQCCASPIKYFERMVQRKYSTKT